MSEQKTYRNRIFFVVVLLCIAGLALVFRLAQWQIAAHKQLAALSQTKIPEITTIPARRGSIFDSNGHLLAADTIHYRVGVSPNILDDPEETTDQLYRLLNIPRDSLLKTLTDASDDGQRPSWIQLNPSVPQEVGDTLLKWNIKGITVEPQARRAHPEGPLAAQLLGIVIENQNGFYEGLYGVEGYYNKFLRGQPGQEVGSWGPLGNYHITAPISGDDIYLTIDRTVQSAVEEELKSGIARYGAESGTAIVMNPKTGAVLALANWPTYDPNNFIETDDALFVDPVVSQEYEPGSVFKIFTMAAALDSNTVAPSTTVYDPGVITIGGANIYNADRQAHGTVDMTTVLAKSLNVGSAQIAVAMGADTFYNYVRRFGFGRITEVDLSDEIPGTLRTPDDGNWYQSTLGTNSFGQGIAVTPLQMVNAVAAIANNGFLMKPHVVKKIITHDTNRTIDIQPQVVRRVVSADTANILTHMLANALNMENSLALIPNYTVAGKTGTAQIPIPGGYHPSLTIASFAGYFPIDDPQIVMIVILNKPTVSEWGTDTAAPTFKRIGEKIAPLLSIPPDNVRLAQQ